MAVLLAVAHQHTGDVVGHIHPFVHVKGQRIGALDAFCHIF
jgi:hypothetical protein